MREKLIELLKQAQYCSVEELADYLIAAGLRLVIPCKECKSFDPLHIRPFLGCCSTWDTAVNECGFCHHGERRKDDSGKGS